MIKQIIGGVLGGLAGYTAGRFYVTFKQVKAEFEQGYEEAKQEADKALERAEMKHDDGQSYESKIIVDGETMSHIVEKDGVISSMVIGPEFGKVTISSEQAEIINTADKITSGLINAEAIKVLDIADILKSNEVFDDVLELHRSITDKEELEDLRHDPQSEAAAKQYIAMRLSDIQEGPIFNVLFQLFDIPFVPKNPEDAIVAEHIHNEQQVFFGDFRNPFIVPNNMAELFLHFAEQLSVDFGESMDHYADILVNFAGYDQHMTTAVLNKLSYMIYSHELYTSEGFGIFGLSPQDNGYLSKSFQIQYFGYREFEDVEL